MQVPTVIVANEHYGRLERLLTRKVPVRVEVNVDAAFTGDREEGFNVLAEIPGVDPVRKDQVVMVGAHLARPGRAVRRPASPTRAPRC